MIRKRPAPPTQAGRLIGTCRTHGRPGSSEAPAFRAKQERAYDQSPRRPTGIALAALSLALAQLTAPDLWFSPGPQASGKERVL
jgi:hypothetical protein